MEENISQPRLMRNYEFSARNLCKNLAKLHFSVRVFSHKANFNEIVGRKMSKFLNISAKNNLCTHLTRPYLVIEIVFVDVILMYVEFKEVSNCIHLN